MRSSLFMCTALAAAVAAWSCGGSSGGGSTPAPTNPTPAPTPKPSVTVTIVGQTGISAFQPNPVTGVSAGDSITFKNSDSTVHHIMLDDGSADLGDLQPGASKAITMKNASSNFHCTIHATMVGSINGTPPEPPPCNNPGYCG